MIYYTTGVDRLGTESGGETSAIQLVWLTDLLKVSHFLQQPSRKHETQKATSMQTDEVTTNPKDANTEEYIQEISKV